MQWGRVAPVIQHLGDEGRQKKKNAYTQKKKTKEGKNQSIVYMCSSAICVSGVYRGLRASPTEKWKQL